MNMAIKYWAGKSLVAKIQLFIRKCHIGMDSNAPSLGLELHLFFKAVKYILAHYRNKKQSVL